MSKPLVALLTFVVFVVVPLLVYRFLEWHTDYLCKKAAKEAWRETQEYMKSLDKRVK